MQAGQTFTIDDETRHAWERDGFVVLRGILGESEIAELSGLLVPLFDRADSVRDMARPDGDSPKQPEVYRPSRLDRRLKQTAAYDRLQAMAKQFYGGSMAYVFDHAIAKMPGTDAVTPLHQDQAYIAGNAKIRSLNLWIPLQDTDERNGTMEYAAGSHRTGYAAHRTSTAAAEHLLEIDRPDIAPSAVHLKAGDIAMHHPLTAHRCGPNMTDHPRYAWILHFGPHGRLAYANPRHFLPALLSKVTGRRVAQDDT